MASKRTKRCWQVACAGLLRAGLGSTIDWQRWTGGQESPTQWYQGENIQYYAPGPVFKLSCPAPETATAKERAPNDDQL